MFWMFLFILLSYLILKMRHTPSFFFHIYFLLGETNFLWRNWEIPKYQTSSLSYKAFLTPNYMSHSKPILLNKKQYAFIAGRQIFDHALIAYEIHRVL